MSTERDIWQPINAAVMAAAPDTSADKIAERSISKPSDLVWMPARWQAPPHVRAWVTSRFGGFSEPPFSSFNLATHVGDDIHAVRANRRLLRDQLPSVKRLQWLDQVHGTEVVSVAPGNQILRTRTGDATAIFAPGDGAVVLTADCLPVFVTNRSGSVAAVAHAGWRGLLDGVLEATVSTVRHGLARTDGAPSGDELRGEVVRRPSAGPTQQAVEPLMAWLGPAIGACHFEVGSEVRDAFLHQGVRREAGLADAFAGPGLEAHRPQLGNPGLSGVRDAGPTREQVEAAFQPCPDRPEKWMMDIYALARLRLRAMGVASITGGGLCTVCDSRHCFSYRRDGVTGRMASLIYLESPD